jgi:hypothetical protein
LKDERPPPDFAMTRAVEVLARLYERQVRRESETRPPPIDRPVQIFNETIAFDVTKTARNQVERALGLAFAYPTGGWHTYCVRGAEGAREFISLFYSRDALASAELYLPKTARAPALEPRNLGRFRLIPGEVALGMQIAALPDGFARMHKPKGLGPYDEILEARFPGGAAYAMASAGRIERLALYALR